MASLFWHSEVRELGPIPENIGELKNLIKDALSEKGFADVRRALDVTGVKNNCFVSIAHFHIADRLFWEIVMCNGDAFEVTKATNEEVVFVGGCTRLKPLKGRGGRIVSGARRCIKRPEISAEEISKRLCLANGSSQTRKY